MSPNVERVMLCCVTISGTLSRRLHNLSFSLSPFLLFPVIFFSFSLLLTSKRHCVSHTLWNSEEDCKSAVSHLSSMSVFWLLFSASFLLSHCVYLLLLLLLLHLSPLSQHLYSQCFIISPFFSFPFYRNSHLIHHSFLAFSLPHRNKVVICRSPTNPHEFVCKRVAWTSLDERYALGLRIPKGSVYLLGDHRIVAKDSRDYGPVPMGLIQGVVSYKVSNSVSKCMSE